MTVAPAVPPFPARDPSLSLGRALGRAALRVVGFWWLVTGLIVAIQRTPLTRWLAFGLATALAVHGARLLHRTRDDVSARGAAIAFVGGAFLWIWVQVAFYGGWIVGPDLPPPTDLGPSPRLLLLAAAATAWNEVAAALALGLAFAVSGRNGVGWITVGTFFACDQLAKLNVFLGVANPGVHFLPEHLGFLVAYFGPPVNSPLLPVSVLVLGGCAAWCLWRAARAAHPYAREASALLAVLVGLAALEHVLLGLDVQLPLWDAFLKARGG